MHITWAPIRSVSVPRVTSSWACKHATHSRINLFASVGAGLLPDENSCGIGNLNFLENSSIGVSSVSFSMEQLSSVC